MVLEDSLCSTNLVPFWSHLMITGFGGPTASQLNLKEVFLVMFTPLGCIVKFGRPGYESNVENIKCLKCISKCLCAGLRVYLPSTSKMMGFDSMILLLTLSLQWYSPASALWTLLMLKDDVKGNKYIFNKKD